MKTWVTFIDGSCFFFPTEKEAKDYIVDQKEEGVEEWIDPPELLEANTDAQFANMLRYACEGLQ